MRIAMTEPFDHLLVRPEQDYRTIVPESWAGLSLVETKRFSSGVVVLIHQPAADAEGMLLGAVH